MCAVSMPFRSAFSSAGCMLNRLATKARLSLLFPEVTSWGDTNCLQSSLAASCSISSARCSRFSSFTNRCSDEAALQNWQWDIKQTDSHSGRSCQSWCCCCRSSPHAEWSGPAGGSRPGSPAEARECVNFLWAFVRFGLCSDTDLNVFAEVPDGFCPCILQVVVDPAQQELLRGERHQVVQSLPIKQKGNQAWRDCC